MQTVPPGRSTQAGTVLSDEVVAMCAAAASRESCPTAAVAQPQTHTTKPPAVNRVVCSGSCNAFPSLAMTAVPLKWVEPLYWLAPVKKRIHQLSTLQNPSRVALALLRRDWWF